MDGIDADHPDSDNELYYDTRSLCPSCLKLVPGRVEAQDGGVFVTRSCPEHGEFSGLTCSDIEWYERLPMFNVDGIRPASPQRPVAKGCPDDCGLCAAHRQIAGTAAVELSNTCDNHCPACLADNRETFQLTVTDVEHALEQVLRSQPRVDVFTLSGGEPCIHPQLFEMIKVLQRPEVGRIAINSNGLRIAQDDAFVQQLAAQDNVYICLHHDGHGAQQLRGVPFSTQQRALERLCQAGVDVVPLVLAARGVNDHELGALVADLLHGPANIKSIMLSMMTYTGPVGAAFPGDPRTRLTIPGALDQLERSPGAALHKRDFMPLVMPNPLCAAIGYFLVMDGEITPLIPLCELERIIQYTANGSFGTVSQEFEGFIRETIDRVYAEPQRFDDAPALLGKFRRLLALLFPEGQPLSDDQRLKAAEQHIKTVYLMQFMDAWTFDSRRLTKCSCQHVLPDGKVVSSCGYYSYHRQFDERFDEPPRPTR